MTTASPLRRHLQAQTLMPQSILASSRGRTNSLLSLSQREGEATSDPHLPGGRGSRRAGFFEQESSSANPRNPNLDNYLSHGIIRPPLGLSFASGLRQNGSS